MRFIFVLMAGICIAGKLRAQIYTPVLISGYNNDVVAEAGVNAVAVTSTALDLSNHILYTSGFAAVNSLQGGMVDNGTIVSGTRTYQLAGYTGNNGLYLSLNGAAPNTTASGVLSLTTPAVFSKLSLLIFSTEGSSSVDVLLRFTDGSVTAVNSHTVLDWFGGSNAVYTAFGRITRLAAPPFVVDGIPGVNPQFYPFDINIPCTYQSKTLQSITVNYISGSGTNARVVVLALSGAPGTPTMVTPVITPATCGKNNGSIQLNVTGGAPPYTYLWSTTPAQTDAMIDSLAAGNYTCRVLDSNGCATIYRGTVLQSTAIAVTASANKPEICAGETVVLSANVSGGVASSYTWMPGNIKDSTVTITPTGSTIYTVNVQDNVGCGASATIPVTVKPVPVAAFTVQPGAGCMPVQQTVTFTGNAGSTAVFNWNNFAGAVIKSGSGRGPYVIQFNAPGAFPIKLDLNENGCSATKTQQVTISGILATPVVTVAAVNAVSITFSWQPVPGATEYMVSIDGGAYISNSSGTTYTVTGLLPSQMVTIDVKAQGTMSCQASTPGRATGTAVAGDIFIPNAFTPNGDGMNDVFKVYGHIIANVHLKIFNQYGELICESRDITEGWNGMHKGKLQPSGVYTYVMRLALTDGSDIRRKGFVLLLR
jgi:gliding motility-associated-like protein